MKYLAVMMIFALGACSQIRSFNNWADSVFPSYDDYFGGDRIVHKDTNPPIQAQVRPTQSKDQAAINEEDFKNRVSNYNGGYQDPSAQQTIYQDQYGRPLYQNEYGQPAYGQPVQTEEFQRDFWDNGIPLPPAGY